MRKATVRFALAAASSWTVILSCAGFASAASAPIAPAISRLLHQNVTQVPVAELGIGTGRPIASGTGFYIARNRVLTNSHVVHDCHALTVGNSSEGPEVPGKTIVDDPRVDLAVLAAEPKDIAPAKIVAVPLEETRDDLEVVGYPEHGLPVLQAEFGKALVFEYDLKQGGPNFIFHGPVRRGNSGGPLLNSHGAVVGVVTAKINTVEVYRQTGTLVDDIGFAISSRTVVDFLRAHQIAFEPEAATSKLSSEELEKKAHGFVRQVRCWN